MLGGSRYGLLKGGALPALSWCIVSLQEPIYIYILYITLILICFFIQHDTTSATTPASWWLKKSYDSHITHIRLILKISHPICSFKQRDGFTTRSPTLAKCFKSSKALEIWIDVKPYPKWTDLKFQWFILICTYIYIFTIHVSIPIYSIHLRAFQKNAR